MVERAKNTVPSFKDVYYKFIERIVINQNSQSMAKNYRRSVAQVALQFGAVPHKLSSEEINSYLNWSHYICMDSWLSESCRFYDGLDKIKASKALILACKKGKRNSELSLS